MKQFYVYVHRKPDGSPFYVGKGSRKRSRQLHAGRSDEYKAIVAQFGYENIQINAFSCDSEEDAFTKERSWIEALRKDGARLVNKSMGGKGGASGGVRSAETRAKISKAHTGRVFSQETLRRLSISHSGCKLSEEHKRKIGAALKGRPPTQIQIDTLARGQLLSTRMLGKKHSDETRRKMSLAQKGRAGNPHTAESKAKIVAALKSRAQSPETRAKISASIRAWRARTKEAAHANR